MSRIAGLISPDEPSARIGPMLDALAAAPSWRRMTAGTPDIALGWTGWRGAGLARGGPLLCVLDGHIYNRDELGVTGSDAEVFLALVERHGFSGALERINGDFAAAVWDGSARALWLGRDRFGLKPLYYAAHRAGLAFASRPKPLVGLPGLSREVNRRFVATFAASHYRYFDNHPAESPYRDVAQLPAGHALRWADGQASLQRYWNLREQPDFAAAEEDLAEQYRALLLDAVRRRVAVAERPGFTLSGGMDSSSVLACAVRETGRKQHAWSTIYKDRTYDESAEIQSMLDATVEAWHKVFIDIPDVFGCVERMVRLHDEPVATATWLSHYLLCGEASREGFGGLFGGLGGDELNAGEYEYFFFHFADLRAAGREDLLDREIPAWVKYHDHPIFRKSRAVVDETLARVVDASRPGVCRSDAKRMHRYLSTLNPRYYDLSAFAPELDHPFASYLKNRTYQDIFRETAPCCLRAEDRQTNAYGLENHLPFFDHRLVEFMFRVPGTMKIREGVTKHLLRLAMKGILPEETRTRVKKTGWNAPAHRWFHGKGVAHLRDMVHSQAFRERGIYNVAEVDRLIDEHEDIVSTGRSQENHMMFFWQLVNLELWLQSLAT